MPLAPFDQSESEGGRLYEVYQWADERFRAAVREMNQQMKTANCEDFNKLAQHVHEVRTETAAALHALKVFESEHAKKW